MILETTQREKQSEKLRTIGDKSHLHQRVIQPETLTYECSSDQLMGGGQVEAGGINKDWIRDTFMAFQTRRTL